MRSGFGGWVVERRAVRVGLIAGLVLLPLAGMLSAALVVAVAIAKGWRSGLIDCVIAAGALVIAGMIGGGAWPQLLVSAVVTWGVALLLGSLTGWSRTLVLPLQTLTVLSVAGIVVFFLAVTDPVGFWERLLNRFVVQMGEMDVQLAAPDALLSLAPMMSGLVAASFVTSSVLALLIGTWWAAAAGGPALRDMFIRIRLGYVIGGIAVVAGVGSLLLPASVAGNAILAVAVAFVFQGLAVVHWHALRRQWPWPYLVPVYLPLLLGASIAAMAVFILAGVGFVDNWYGLRRVGGDER